MRTAHVSPFKNRSECKTRPGNTGSTLAALSIGIYRFRALPHSTKAPLPNAALAHPECVRRAQCLSRKTSGTSALVPGCNVMPGSLS